MNPAPNPSPDLFFDIITSYQKTAALKSALDLNLFTALADGSATAREVATRCQAAERGVRILCDYMVILGFLKKDSDRYSLTQDSAVFLNRQSPGYIGSAAEFLLSDELTRAFENLSASVKKGGTAQSPEGSTAPEHPMWMTFARVMGGLMVPASQGLAEMIPLDPNRTTRVLDISASHGAWGIAFAKKNPRTELVALDWASVLEVARENAAKAGMSDRFSTIAGSAFEVDLGSNYDVVLVPNFLHHFSVTDCIRFLKKVHASLRPGGSIAIVEFVPNPDRVSPPQAAGFAVIMLATTPAGDAYTVGEYKQMLTDAGFTQPSVQPLPASMNLAIVARKA